eukprot:366333-Chlamydomonas_euryale.AAC.8
MPEQCDKERHPARVPASQQVPAGPSWSHLFLKASERRAVGPAANSWLTTDPICGCGGVGVGRGVKHACAGAPTSGTSRMAHCGPPYLPTPFLRRVA